MKIIVEKLTDEQINSKGIKNWPIWTKEVSKFDWQYDSVETCLILEGKAIISTPEGKTEIKAGDFVSFPNGLKCTWEVVEKIKKHYNFE